MELFNKWLILCSVQGHFRDYKITCTIKDSLCQRNLLDICFAVSYSHPFSKVYHSSQMEYCSEAGGQLPLLLTPRTSGKSPHIQCLISNSTKEKGVSWCVGTVVLGRQGRNSISAVRSNSGKQFCLQ